MIARIWTARTTRAQAPAYAAHLRTRVFARLRGIDGFVHALLLQREVGDEIEVEAITFWRSIEAIRAFAGPDAEAAVVADAAAALLTAYDRRATHFQVVLGDDLTGRSPASPPAAAAAGDRLDGDGFGE